MAAELHLLESPLSHDDASAAMAPSQPTATAAPPPPAAANTGAATAAPALAPSISDNPGPSLAPKRHRRPSVRLGEIGGEQPGTAAHDSHVRRPKPTSSWRLPKESSNPQSSKSVKARSLTHLVNGDAQFHDLENSSGFDFPHRKVKARRGIAAKRPRSCWTSSKLDNVADNIREDEEEEINEGFRDFGADSGSPTKEHSPASTDDAAALDNWQRRPSRGRASLSRDNGGNEFDTARESDYRDGKGGSSDGVRSWLVELGLSRYAPVFEIHEVDDEVLPMLTLEDLKDMGINAVGSRRKMYSAIQKLRKGFS
ncbi:protein bicaudal C homolog 1-like [Rhodamnia argentea]|uniref:Protein bicaudal C homolog 1-like n=1 Tax=Rhodamnia argentea TaxID=178133 RepID=A0A8B8PXC2_9MYRT|nr:protein bicaudal C homolog 1-like [Rhodamnia argentea]XP_030539431.2 protein bicaudal C homolog 1-like [Rhodamnia argentea]XP_030539433.2 protein bicaudal C homolog 1-like [Rhodamnia argentea]